MHPSQSLLPILSLLLLSPLSAYAVYFTAPSTGTDWASALGEVMTWNMKAGDAIVADIVLGTAELDALVTVQANVTLATESLAWPAGVTLNSPSKSYYLYMVNSANQLTIYTQVGPFSIESFSRAGVAPVTPLTTSSSSPNTATEGSPVTETQPAFGTAGDSTTSSSAKNPKATLRTPLTTSNSAASSTATTSSTPSTTSTTPSSSSTSTSTSIIPTTTHTPTTVEITSTASAITLTSTSQDDGPVTVLVTATAENTAASVLSRPSSSSTTSGAVASLDFKKGRTVAVATMFALITLVIRL